MVCYCCCSFLVIVFPYKGQSATIHNTVVSFKNRKKNGTRCAIRAQIVGSRARERDRLLSTCQWNGGCEKKMIDVDAYKYRIPLGRSFAFICSSSQCFVLCFLGNGAPIRLFRQNAKLNIKLRILDLMQYIENVCIFSALSNTNQLQ